MLLQVLRSLFQEETSLEVLGLPSVARTFP